MGRSTKSRECKELIKVIILDTNGVAVARYGLVLSEDGATGSRKVFRCLLGLWEAIENSKMTAKVNKIKNTYLTVFLYIYICIYIYIYIYIISDDGGFLWRLMVASAGPRNWPLSRPRNGMAAQWRPRKGVGLGDGHGSYAGGPLWLDNGARCWPA